jgi:hypothetical protein
MKLMSVDLPQQEKEAHVALRPDVCKSATMVQQLQLT